MLYDSGFLGGADTPFTRIRLRKPCSIANNAQEKAIDHWYATKRVKIECFFGRMTKVFRLISKPYIFDANRLATDVDNIVMLTNEHIITRVLEDDDSLFWRQWMESNRRAVAERRAKKQTFSAAYRKRTRAVMELDSQGVDMDEEEDAAPLPGRLMRLSL